MFIGKVILILMGSFISSKTLFSVGLLILWGGIMSGIAGVLVMNLGGLPGALCAGRPGQRSKLRFWFGVAISTLGQSYVYLASVALIVNWTTDVIKHQSVSGFVMWPVAFLASVVPVYMSYIRASVEYKQEQLPYANPQLEGLGFTLLLSLVAFFVFVFAPSMIGFGWGWVPFGQ